jgi:DMSO/TMAO reductase YedYZ molybdopterin-dependent catalytic subunit
MKREAQIQLCDHRSAVRRLERRLLLKASMSAGALTMLTGCNLHDGDAVDRVLWAMSRWNDRVQALLFNPNRLAPTYPASAITKPFTFNAFYPVDDAPEIDGDDYTLEVSGLVADKQSWTLAKLRTLPQQSQITRHICIEGWSAIVAASHTAPVPLAMGGVAGLALACAVSWLLYRGLVIIPLHHLFGVTNELVALLAAGMAGQAAAMLNSADLLPSWGQQL